MNYTIGQAAELTGLPVSTLYYYDKMGLFPEIRRDNSGARIFTETEIKKIHQIESLKSTGFTLKEIKAYLQWQKEGDGTLEKRRALFYKKLQTTRNKLDDLEKARKIIEFHCRYYDEAVAQGTEQELKERLLSDLPPEIRKTITLMLSVTSSSS